MISYVFIGLLMGSTPQTTTSVIVDNFKTENSCHEFAKTVKDNSFKFDITFISKTQFDLVSYKCLPKNNS